MTTTIKTTIKIHEEDASILERLQEVTHLKLHEVASIGVNRLIEEFERTGEICAIARGYDSTKLAKPDFVEMSFLSHCLSDPQFATERMIDANVAATAFETTFGKAVAHAIDTHNVNGWDIDQESIRSYLSKRSLSAEDAEKALQKVDRCDPSKLHKSLREELETLWDQRFPTKRLAIA